MKKILLLLALVTFLVLVSCGSETATTTEAVATTKGDTITTPVVTTEQAVSTTAPITTVADTTAVITTADTTVTTEPSDAMQGVDILNGEPEDRAINATWKGTDAIAFENHHSILDFNVALVMLMIESENAVYENLFITKDGEEGSDAWERNLAYKWVVTVDGVDIEIERFSIYHQVTKGYVRLDLGSDFKYSTDVDENGMHAYDVWLRIYDVDSDEIAYYAWFTDPAWNGLYEFVPPTVDGPVYDDARDPSHVAVDGAIPFSGPNGYTGELYGNLFDGDVRSKLCTADVTTPIVWKYPEAVEVVSYSLIGARDDASYKSRVLTKWKLYGSNDGNTWTLLDEQNLEAPEKVTNYGERNFKLKTPAEYTYFMFEPIEASKYQLSELLLYKQAE